jgi:predicted GNAT family N-acyltransferase
LKTEIPIYTETRMATPEDIPAILALRKEYLGELPWYISEVEEHDLSSKSHLVAVVSANGDVVASGRLDREEYAHKITRVVTTSSMQGIGLGKKVLNTLIELAQVNESKEIKLKARLDAKSFYEKFGFLAVSPIYSEHGFSYVDMVKTLNKS